MVSVVPRIPLVLMAPGVPLITVVSLVLLAPRVPLVPLAPTVFLVPVVARALVAARALVVPEVLPNIRPSLVVPVDPKVPYLPGCGGRVFFRD